MALTRGQRRLETAGGWAALPKELLENVLAMLEALHAAERGKPQEEGLGFSQAVAVVRLVCPGWQAVHDALVKRLVFDKGIVSDEPVCMLVRRFPAVVSVQFAEVGWMHLMTDEAVRAVMSLPAHSLLSTSKTATV
jgi:hypothetical protein